jgi:hypothetical protein
MIKLIDLLKEGPYSYTFTNRNHLFPTNSGESAMFGIVISHPKGISEDEAREIISLYDKDDKESDLKYYPSTKKVVGKVGAFRFFMPGKVSTANVSMKPSLDKARLKAGLDKIKAGLEITKKTIHK